MTKPSLSEKRETVRAGILADRISRAARWAYFAAIVCGLIAPLVVHAWRERGALVALAVGALLLSLAWHVKPQGRSLSARLRELDAPRFPRE